MRQNQPAMLPPQSKMTSVLINWDLELIKAILVEKVQGLKCFCLRELNQFIDNLRKMPLLGTFTEFLQRVDGVNSFRALEKLVLDLIDFVDDVFENLIARSEQVIQDFRRTLPHFLNLPALRTTVNSYFVEEILPLFVSEVVIAPMTGSRK